MAPVRPSIPRVARYTLARQWPAEVMLGAFMGVFGLAAFAARRSLGAPEWIVPLIVVAGQVPWIFASVWRPLLGRVNPSKAFLWLGLVSKGPLLLIALVEVTPIGASGRGTGDLWLFFTCIALFYVGDAAYIPHRGALIGTNYPLGVRGRMFGLLATFTMLASVMTAKVSGWILDGDPRSLRFLFPIAAVIGMAGHVLMSRIRWRHLEARRAQATASAGGAGASLRRAWRDTVRILATDRSFRTYEIAFMLYGFALLMSVPLIVLYGEGDLGVSYDQWTWAHGFAFPVAYLLTVAALGRAADRLGVIRLTGIAFMVLTLFMILVPFVTTPLHLVGVFVLFGIAMAGVILGWNLGPLHFAPEGKNHAYMAVHLSLVGVRSGVAPFAGYFLTRWISLRFAFWVAAALMALAVVILLRVGPPAADRGED